MPERTIILTKEEAKLVRTLIRIDMDADADDYLSGQQMTVTWDEARAIGEVLMKHMTKAMAGAHETGELGDLDDIHARTQSVNQKIMDEFRGQTAG